LKALRPTILERFLKKAIEAAARWGAAASKYRVSNPLSADLANSRQLITSLDRNAFLLARKHKLTNSIAQSTFKTPGFLDFAK